MSVRFYGPVDEDEEYCEYDDGTCEGSYWRGKTTSGVDLGVVCDHHKDRAVEEAERSQKEES